MAEQDRHAAGQVTYEVTEVHGGDPGVGLGIVFRSVDYAHAVEFAFEYLARRDPDREGSVDGLEVVKNDRGKRETVWTYAHTSRATQVDPMRRWGYDVTRNWEGPRVPVRPLPLGGRISRRM